MRLDFCRRSEVKTAQHYTGALDWVQSGKGAVISGFMCDSAAELRSSFIDVCLDTVDAAYPGLEVLKLYWQLVYGADGRLLV